MREIKFGSRTIGGTHPTYFIADISANHDGDLERAKALVHLSAEAGADAAKFQNFKAPEIVSKEGFESMGAQLSHQGGWKKSVYQVYEEASIPWAWTEILAEECGRAGIDYFSTPYDFGAVDMLDPYVEIFKIGSGDITWLEMLKKIAGKGKPVLLATGASEIGEVQTAVDTIRETNDQIVLMQCNTNYTGSLENFAHIHLNVLRTYQAMYPDVVIGLSDHTPGHSTVLGAVALGARAVEKHFTDDVDREGPDHPFSMTPASWRDMVDRIRELELALGSTRKFVADNEADTAIVQRRCIRARKDLKSGQVIDLEDLTMLRPAPVDALPPDSAGRIVGSRLRCDVMAGSHLTNSMFS